LEDCLMILKMTSASRTRGRKPAGYTPLVTIKDVVEFAMDKELNKPKASGAGAFTIK
jgi:hypothetical protein